MHEFRIGCGYDVHAFSRGRELFLGGVKIEHKYGLAGHSDADVLIHAIIDSLLGAASLGDIGSNFPDSSPQYKNISSIDLLKQVEKLLSNKKIQIVNIDCVIICEDPKVAPYISKMKDKISWSLGGLQVDRIGIKGKTTEGLGFTGRREGIASHAVSLISLPE